MRRFLPLIIFSSLAFAQEAPVGIVTLAQGDAKLFAPNSRTAAKPEMADLILPGTRIMTAGGNVNFVSCSQSQAAQIQPNSEVIFTAAGYEVKKGNVSQTHKVPACRIPTANIGGPNAHIGGVNMRGDETTMRLLSPVGTSVDPSQVTFKWHPVEGATIYRVALRDAKGNDFWESEAKAPDTSVAYVGDKKLAPGTSYRWRVTALQGEDVLSSASAKMDTLSEEALARIAQAKNNGDSPEGHLLLGILYEELNAPELALAEYEKIGGKKSKWLEDKISTLKTPEK